MTPQKYRVSLRSRGTVDVARIAGVFQGGGHPHAAGCTVEGKFIRSPIEDVGSRKGSSLNGVLVIDKPKGWTSHDVVARVRKVLRVKKAGHGGTLDPLATGVLPVYLEEGTKLVPFNLEGTKEYRATMKLGQETDTLDADGRITAGGKKDFPGTPEMIEEALEKFRGTIRQVPPLFSAIKQKGLPLYQRARAGERPKVAEREVRVHALSLKEVSLPLVTLEITCGRGTYIRSLVRGYRPGPGLWGPSG